MLKTNNRNIALIKKLALYFFVLSFSLSNISFFNMVLYYTGYTGNITVLSSAIYAFFNLFILIFFFHYVLAHKAYKALSIILIVNLVYALPFIINLDIKGTLLYLMFPLSISLITGILTLDRELRKEIIEIFCKLRYVYVVLAIAYICFLAFYPKDGRAVLINFTYGNVAWVFLPPIFIYTGLLYKQNIQQEFKLNKRAAIERIIILLILDVTVFYTGLRSGIISLLFTNVLFLLGNFYINFKQRKQHLQNFVLVLTPFLIAFTISSSIKMEASRFEMISDNFIFESFNGSDNTENDIDLKENDTAETENDTAETENDTVLAYNEEVENAQKIAGSTKRYTTSALPVRPEKNSEISLGTLPKGSIIEGFEEGAWFRFVYQDREAFIASKFTSTEKPIEMKTVYTTSALPIRPEKNSEISLGTLPKGLIIEGFEEGAWFRFVYQDREVFIASKSTSKEKPVEMKTVYTTSPLPIRPERKSKISLGTLPKGSIIEGFREGVWFRFIHKGKQAFIASKYISTEKPIKINLYTTSALPIRPEKNSEKSLGLLPKWTEVEGFEEGMWFRFIYKGKQAFIASNSLREEAPTSDELRANEIDNLLAENDNASLIKKFNVIDVEDGEIKSVHEVFMKHITENNFCKRYTEKILREDVLEKKENYLIVRDRDRGRLARFRIKNNRDNLWSMAINEFKKSPIIGHGALFYQKKYDNYFPHNIILEIMTDFGIVGLIIILSFITLFLIRAIVLIKEQNNLSMAFLLLFGLSYIPAFLFYNSLYGDNAFAYLITLLVTYVILNANGKIINFKWKKQIAQTDKGNLKSD